MAGEVRRKQKGESAMSYKIVLQPGELNDANRDYLPKACLLYTSKWANSRSGGRMKIHSLFRRRTRCASTI